VVLVTGASGFIGGHLCDRLTSGGAVVCGLSRSSRQPGGDRYRPRRVDLTDASAAADAISHVHPEIIFHLAGLVTGRRDLDLVLPTLHHGLVATVHVLLAAAKTGCERVVVVSSSEEFRHGLAATSPYGAAKAAASVYCDLFHARYGLPVVVARPHMTYGPRQEKTKLIPYIITSLLRRETPLVRNGLLAYDFIHVDDVVSGLLDVGIQPQAIGQHVDLGTGTAARIRDVAELLADLVGYPERPTYAAVPDQPGDTMRIADVDATRRLVGWEATRALPDGLDATVAWYRNHPDDA
jgi:UDP-glucose 4-epimerase